MMLVGGIISVFLLLVPTPTADTQTQGGKSTKKAQHVSDEHPSRGGLRRNGVIAIPALKENITSDGKLVMSFHLKTNIQFKQLKEVRLILSHQREDPENTIHIDDENTNPRTIQYCFWQHGCGELKNARSQSYGGKNVYDIIDITRAFRKWKARLCQTNCIVNFTVPIISSLMPDYTHMARSVLVFFPKQTTPKSRSPFIAEGTLKSESRQKRSYKDTANMMHKEYDDDGGPCRVVHWHLNYDDAGLPTFMGSLNASYCAGSCRSEETSESENTFTNHALLKIHYLSKNAGTGKRKVPEPRCVPSHYMAAKVLIDDQDGFSSRRMPNMVVEKCMCV